MSILLSFNQQPALSLTRLPFPTVLIIFIVNSHEPLDKKQQQQQQRSYFINEP